MAEKTHKEHAEQKQGVEHSEGKVAKHGLPSTSDLAEQGSAMPREPRGSHGGGLRSSEPELGAYRTPAGFSVRGAVLEGVVVSAKAPKTITIERFITKYIPKYERYKKIRSKVKAHLPDGVMVKEGDTVLIGETRKLSKTKSFVLLSVVKRGNA